MKKVNQDAIQRSVKDSIIPAVYNIIAPFISNNPILSASLGLVAVTFGAALIYRQERINHIMQDIQDNPNIFTNEILQSKDFQDGFVVFIDTYFKIRGEDKLKIAHDIFYDFTISDSMPTYPLERYDDTLEKLSDAGIRFIGFIVSKLPAIKEDYLNYRMQQNSNSKDEQYISGLRKAYIDNQSLNTFVDFYIEKGKADNKDLNVDGLELVISEMEQLGIIKRFSNQMPGWDGGSVVSGYNLTHYGQMFISVIRPDTIDNKIDHMV